MSKVQHILNEIASLESEDRHQLFQQLVDFEVFKTQKKVTQQKLALGALIGIGSSGHTQNDHDQILTQAEMTANQ